MLLGVVTLSARPGGRLIEAVDSPLDLRAFDGGLRIAYQAAFAVIIRALMGAAGFLVGRFSRTLAYGLLTLLGAGYALVVLGLSQLLGRASPLVVAAATLAGAAVFQPARRRIQEAVDRRFNRRRHDATRSTSTP